jgi:hypothetical protein
VVEARNSRDYGRLTLPSRNKSNKDVGLLVDIFELVHGRWLGTVYQLATVRETTIQN